MHLSTQEYEALQSYLEELKVRFDSMMTEGFLFEETKMVYKEIKNVQRLLDMYADQEASEQKNKSARG